MMKVIKNQYEKNAKSIAGITPMKKEGIMAIIITDTLTWGMKRKSTILIVAPMNPSLKSCLKVFIIILFVF